MLRLPTAGGSGRKRAQPDRRSALMLPSLARAAAQNSLFFHPRAFTFPAVTVDLFQREINAALKVYDRHVVCLEKTPDDVLIALNSLVAKAIKAFEERGPNLRHGIALDRQITVILSQTDGPKPLCGIYFNLCSPYQKSAAKPSAKAASKAASDSPGSGH